MFSKVSLSNVSFLISGKAVSLRVDGSRIRTLEKGDVYGAEMFFSGDKGFNATFVAYTKCLAAFLPYKSVIEIMEKTRRRVRAFCGI